MEPIGAVVACLDILDRSLRILDRARKAWDRTKNGISYLDNICFDVKAIIGVVNVVNLAPELQGEPVSAAVSQLSSTAARLEKILDDLEKESEADKSKFRKFMKHFIDGNGEKEMMEGMRRDLNDGKSTLILSLVTAQVGITQVSGKGDIIINVVEVSKVDKLFRDCPDLEEGLRIVKLLRARGKKEIDGSWHLLEDDLEELQNPPPYPPYPEPVVGRTRQFVDNNKAQSGGFLLGGNLGKDGGDSKSIYHVDDLFVRNNVVSTGGIMIGGGTSLENMVGFLQARAANPYPLPLTPLQPQDSKHSPVGVKVVETDCDKCQQEFCICEVPARN